LWWIVGVKRREEGARRCETLFFVDEDMKFDVKFQRDDEGVKFDVEFERDEGGTTGSRDVM
jgi:hypothetical protein